jgi:hypothetical protein
MPVSWFFPSLFGFNLCRLMMGRGGHFDRLIERLRLVTLFVLSIQALTAGLLSNVRV